MNWLDVLIGAIVLVSSFWSLRRGFILELFYFLALVGGLIMSFLTYPWISPFLKSLLGGTDIGATTAFFLTFILFGGSLVLLGLFLHKFVHLIKLGFFDRLLGAAFGFMKAVVGIAVVLVILVAVEGEPTPGYLENSYLAQPVVAVSTGVMKRVPLVFDEFREDYGQRAEEWLDTLEYFEE